MKPPSLELNYTMLPEERKWKSMDIKDHAVGYLFGLSAALIAYLYRRLCVKVNHKLLEQEALKNGMQALLRDRIIQAYNYHIEKGYCAIHDKDNICNLYSQYHKLGANGVADHMVDKINQLPTRRTEDVVK